MVLKPFGAMLEKALEIVMNGSGGNSKLPCSLVKPKLPGENPLHNFLSLHYNLYLHSPSLLSDRTSLEKSKAYARGEFISNLLNFREILKD